jgi:hypothetical protein
MRVDTRLGNSWWQSRIRRYPRTKCELNYGGAALGRLIQLDSAIWSRRTKYLEEFQKPVSTLSKELEVEERLSWWQEASKMDAIYSIESSHPRTYVDINRAQTRWCHFETGADHSGNNRIWRCIRYPFRLNAARPWHSGTAVDLSAVCINLMRLMWHGTIAW